MSEEAQEKPKPKWNKNIKMNVTSSFIFNT